MPAFSSGEPSPTTSMRQPSVHAGARTTRLSFSASLTLLPATTATLAMFVPRVVKKKIQSSEAPRPPVVPPASALAPPLPPPAFSAPTTNNSASPVTSSSKPQAGSEAADIECAAAIELLFSDYNLSLDPDELHLSARMGRNNGCQCCLCP